MNFTIRERALGFTLSHIRIHVLRRASLRARKLELLQTVHVLPDGHSREGEPMGAPRESELLFLACGRHDHIIILALLFQLGDVTLGWVQVRVLQRGLVVVVVVNHSRMNIAMSIDVQCAGNLT